MERVKEQLKLFSQEQTFMNKRKAEYLELLKQPCFSETVIRVKLPNNWVWECTFSPLETLATLVEIFHEVRSAIFRPYSTRTWTITYT